MSRIPAKEATGETITPPGLPLPVEEHEKFMVSNCITCELWQRVCDRR